MSSLQLVLVIQQLRWLCTHPHGTKIQLGAVETIATKYACSFLFQFLPTSTRRRNLETTLWWLYLWLFIVAAMGEIRTLFRFVGQVDIIFSCYSTMSIPDSPRGITLQYCKIASDKWIHWLFEVVSRHCSLSEVVWHRRMGITLTCPYRCDRTLFERITMSTVMSTWRHRC